MSQENQASEVFFNRVDQDTLTNVARQASLGCASILRKSLIRGEVHDVCDNRGWFPIHRAASSGHNECVQILLAHNERNYKNKKTFNGETPVFLAASNGHSSVMRTLLEFNADIKLTNNELMTVLVAAIKGKNNICVQICLENKVDVNAQDAGGWSALHEAAYIGNSEVIKILLTAKAKINVQNSDKATPLFIAAQHGHIQCLNTLINYKANVHLSTKDKATPLFIASQEGHSECVKALLDAGAMVENKTTSSTTALHTAAERGHVNIVRQLIKAGAEVNAKSEQDVTPLFLAADEDRIDCLIELIESGADMNAKLQEDQGTPLELACTVGSVKCCEELLKRGCNPNRVFLKNNSLKTSTLMEAVEAEESKCVEILLKYGADPNHCTYSYPILTAAKNCDPHCLSLLIKAGANVDIIDQGNNTPIMLCLIKVCLYIPSDKESLTQLKCIEMLLKAGADATTFLSKFNLIVEEMLVKIPLNVIKLLLVFHPQDPHIRKYLNNFRRWYDDGTGEIEELYKLLENPCNLIDLCRLKVRHILGRERLSAIGQLPIPIHLQRYLEFKD